MPQSEAQRLKTLVSLSLENIVYSEIAKKTAQTILIREHGLHRRATINYAYAASMPSRSLIKGIMGIIAFGRPMWSVMVGAVGEKKADLKRDDANWHHVYELTRCWMHHAQPPNAESRFIAWCFQRLREIDPHAIVVSYADSAFGHAGYLYQGLNFQYTGTSIAFTDRTIEGVDHRSLTRERLKGPDVMRKVRSKKHRYVLFLNKRDRKLLGWPILPYPKITPPSGHAGGSNSLPKT